MGAWKNLKRDFLVTRAGNLPHSRESLVRHLEATSGLLRAWSSRKALCDAGLFHSVYGTDTFAKAIVADAERTAVQDIIGAEAESLVWLFGRCSQQSIVDSAKFGGSFIDRVDCTELTLTDQQRRDLCELSAANWLEQRPRLDADVQSQLLAAVRATRLRLRAFSQTSANMASALSCFAYAYSKSSKSAFSPFETGPSFARTRLSDSAVLSSI